MEKMKTPFPEFDLSGKVALITGAGRGMGSCIAQAYARYGADLALASRTEGELEETAKKAREFGGRVMVRPTDLTDVDQIRALVGDVVEEYGRIDVLLNNAGVNVPQWAEDVTPENWDKVMDINLRGLFFCAQAVGRVMIEQKGGKIINMSSQAGSVALIKRSAYCSSKGAVDQLTRVLAIEWAKHNITVNGIAPTFVEGPFTKPMFEDPEFKEYVLGNIPLGRIAQPEDIVGAAVYLAAPASDMVTGSTLLIDGGWTAK